MKALDDSQLPAGCAAYLKMAPAARVEWKGVDFISDELRAWFAGVGPLPWSALLPPDHYVLCERWAIYKKQSPGAAPPAGFEWIAKS